MMKWIKKAVIALVVIVVCLVLYGMYQELANKELMWEKGQIVKIFRGDLAIPISATGSIEPASRTPIKSKASGTVTRIYFEPGDMVRAGDLLVELDPTDEKRAFDDAKTLVARAKANLERARTSAEQRAREWPTQMMKALANLEKSLADLQNQMVAFQRQDRLRKDENADVITIAVVDPDAVQLEGLEPADNFHVRKCDKKLALSAVWIAEAGKMVDYGRAVLTSENQEGMWQTTTWQAYNQQWNLVWKTQSALQGACAAVREAVDMQLVVKQARTEVDVVREDVRKAEVVLDTARQRVEETKVYAPITGQVQKVLVQEGTIISSGVTTVTGGTLLMELADMSELYVEADVDEADIGRVRDLAPPGRAGRLSMSPTTAPDPKQTAADVALLESTGEVKVTVDAFRDETFVGRVDRVYPDPKIANNVVTYSVRILLTSKNRHKLLMLGFHANVDFTAQERTNVLQVDFEAIQVKDNQRGVYIPGDPDPVFVPVEVGAIGPDTIEIRTDTLKEGQEVYTKLPQRPKSKAEKEREEEED